MVSANFNRSLPVTARRTAISSALQNKRFVPKSWNIVMTT
jgi:hypothetical protein